MKPLLYHIIACCVAVLFFIGCGKECDIPGSHIAGDGNSIILDLSTGALPISRAANMTPTGAEVKVDHIDVLIFDTDGDKKHHERVVVSETGNGTIVLSAKRSDFDVNAAYEVHLIANSTADVSTFTANDFNKTKLWQLEQTDRNIHMTGYPNSSNLPQTFLMDGIAHLTDEPTDTQVVLNDGNKSNDTKLEATLRRAAAKLVIKIHKGESVEFNASPGSKAGYYLRNMPYSTSVLTGVDAEATLRTSEMTAGSYFAWTKDPDHSNPDDPYTLITVTAYAYAHSWENESSLEKETRLIVNIPMWVIRDENGALEEPQEYENSYYQIPVCEKSELKRNTCYEVSLTLNVPGGTDPSKPVELSNIEYDVHEWVDKTIDIGGETDRPEYLTLNEEEFEMHNMEDDHTTLQFASSSEVTATINKVYYIDKFGQEQVLTNISGDKWGVKGGSSYNPTYTNQCTLRITPDEGINGKIDVFGTVPENNAVRYIEFTIENETGQSRNVTVAQYPLEYITNIQGWYSYRSDFGGTNYQNKGTNRYVTASNYRNGKWNYSSTINATANGFFSSIVATLKNDGTGTSTLRHYTWSRNGNSATEESAINNRTNARMYHVQITASSGTYTLGKPRITNGKTDPGTDNAKLVSPSFMIASQLGMVYSSPTGTDMAASHCENYVETYKDKNGNVVHLDDWRLPTEAELLIIKQFQGKSDAIDVVLTGNNYYSASGSTYVGGGQNGTFLRCIRDAYDDK